MTSRNPAEIEQDIERTRSDMRSTLDAIEQKLAPQRLFEQAMETVREVVKSDSGIARTVKENPIPLALMGIGAVWLFIAGSRGSGKRYSGDYDFETGARTGYGYGAEGVGSDYTSDYQVAGEAGLADSSLSGLQKRAGRAYDRAKGTASRYAEGASRYTQTMQGRAEDWAKDAKSRVDELSSRAADLYDQHPIAIGVGAVLVGAIIGASLGRTRTEDELMGRQRDDLMRQADQTAAEALRKGEAIAAKAIEGARDAAAGETPADSSGHTTGGRVMH